MKSVYVTGSVLLFVLVFTFILDISQGETFEGTPDWTQVVVSEDGRFVESVYVEWTYQGSTQFDFVTFPESQRGDETLTLKVHDGSAQVDWVTGTTYLFAGFIGLLLGLVVDMSLRGYGYVRGTGKTGETPDLNVGEERGFYWRT